MKRHLISDEADLLICHGYKASLLGWRAARRAGIPVLAVSRGWTSENAKIRLYEWLERRVLRLMDRVVCVSIGQARKIRHAGVPEQKIVVIHNAIRTERFSAPPDPAWRAKLNVLFSNVPTYILGAAGRLSPEKGFDVLIQACQQLADHGTPDFGLALFGDGPLRNLLQHQIDAVGLAGRVVLAGFTDELDRYMPHFDVFVQSSQTEGLPNVLLEAAAAGVPVVATDVGGTAEVIAQGRTGVLVPRGDAKLLAASIRSVLSDAASLARLGEQGRVFVAEHFSFVTQAKRYAQLFGQLLESNAVSHSIEPKHPQPLPRTATSCANTSVPPAFTPLD